MERGKRDARFGRERRDARFGGERRDTRFGDSEWLEDSGVQGACPFSHHRLYAHMYKCAPGGSGAVGPQSPVKRAGQQLRARAAASLKTPYGAARACSLFFHLTLRHKSTVIHAFMGHNFQTRCHM